MDAADQSRDREGAVIARTGGHSDFEKGVQTDQSRAREEAVTARRRSDVQFAGERGEPVAYFITFHTYGTWAHGTDRGSVDVTHNVYGQPFLETDEWREQQEFLRMKHEPVTLDATRRGIVDKTVREVCEFRSWTLHELNVRTNHVHAVVSAGHMPEKVMNDFKAYAMRRMVEAGVFPADTRAWTRHGSTRYLWKAEDIDPTCTYVRELQGEELPQADIRVFERPPPVPGRADGAENASRSVVSQDQAAVDFESRPLPYGRRSEQASQPKLTQDPTAVDIASQLLPYGRGSDQLDAFVHQAVDDWRKLRLRAGVRALLEYAEKLTLRPSDCAEDDVKSLRGQGWSDNDIHDAAQVAAYFNYINRIADGLGVELEAGHPRWGRAK